MELTRKQVIEILDLIKKQYQPFNINQQRLICAIDYAISSLKTDEMYQLMYEGEDVYTKADMVTMLEDLKKEMNPIKECEYQIYGKEEWNFVGKCQDVIQQKINELRGEK